MKFQVKKLNASEPLTNTIGLDGISAKMDSYSTLDEYLADIDQMIQSYTVRFSSECPLLDFLQLRNIAWTLKITLTKTRK